MIWWKSHVKIFKTLSLTTLQTWPSSKLTCQNGNFLSLISAYPENADFWKFAITFFSYCVWKIPFRYINCTCWRVMCVNCKVKGQMTKKLLRVVWVPFFLAHPVCVIRKKYIDKYMDKYIYRGKLERVVGKCSG